MIRTNAENTNSIQRENTTKTTKSQESVVEYCDVLYLFVLVFHYLGRFCGLISTNDFITELHAVTTHWRKADRLYYTWEISTALEFAWPIQLLD